MVSKELVIMNKTGLHARPASKFVQVANSYKCEIYIEKDNTKINAKSIMGVMILGASKGTKITIIADGLEEEAALKALSDLIESKFGEE